MEEYKFDIYLQETGNVFIGIKQLTTTAEQHAVISDLYKKSGLSDVNINLFVDLRESLTETIFTIEETDDLKFIFDRLDLDKTGDVYLIWDDKNIDQISIRSLIDNWQYIWYGISDEAVIIYIAALKKIILITHYGSVFHN